MALICRSFLLSEERERELKWERTRWFGCWKSKGLGFMLSDPSLCLSLSLSLSLSVSLSLSFLSLFSLLYSVELSSFSPSRLSRTTEEESPINTTSTSAHSVLPLLSERKRESEWHVRQRGRTQGAKTEYSFGGGRRRKRSRQLPLVGVRSFTKRCC